MQEAKGLSRWSRIKDAMWSLRQAHDLMQTEFAERLGLSSVVIADWETGVVVPTDANLEIVQREFGADLRPLAVKARAARKGKVSRPKQTRQHKPHEAGQPATLNPNKGSLSGCCQELRKSAQDLLVALDSFEVRARPLREELQKIA